MDKTAQETVGDWIAQGYAALDRKDPSGAAEAFSRAADADPGSAAARYGLALARFAEGEFEACREMAEAALNLDQQNGDYALLLGLVNRDLGEFEASADYLAKATRWNPDSSPAWRELGL